MPCAILFLGVDIEYIQAVCSVATVVGVIFSLLYVAKQVRLLREQTRQSNAAVHSQTYHAIYDRMIQIDQFFVEHPDIKGYVYGELAWPDDPGTQRTVMSACEMLADLLQKLVQLHSHAKIDRENWLGWNRYMRTIYSTSPSFQRFFDTYGWWYTIDLTSLLAAPSKLACVPCELEIDFPSVGQIKEDTTFWSIYEEAFPADKKESRDVIYSTVSDKKGFVIRARYHEYHYHDEHTVGLAIVHDLFKVRAYFLVYLGVGRAVRGHGIGSQLLRKLQGGEAANVAGFDRRDGTVVEVDDPDCAEDEGERAKRQRRVTFFQEAGFRLLLKGYWQPSLGPEKKPVQMLLMVAGSVGEPKAIVKAIYTLKYGAVNGVPAEVLNELYGRTFGKNLNPRRGMDSFDRSVEATA